MKEYVFYTFEGYTQSPTEKDCENIQILGFESGTNREKAKETLIKTREWIKDLDFDIDEIEDKQLLTNENKQDIKTVIDYLWKDEYKNFEECDFPKNHIFTTLKKLKHLIN